LLKLKVPWLNNHEIRIDTVKANKLVLRNEDPVGRSEKGKIVPRKKEGIQLRWRGVE
jgi:hypothetical protein